MNLHYVTRGLLFSAALGLGMSSSQAFGSYASTVLADNPEAFYQFDNAAPLADSSGFGHNLSLNGGSDLTQGTTGLVTGDPGQSVTLAGFERMIAAGFNKINTGYTAEYWINVTAYPGNCCSAIVGDGGAPGNFYMMNYLIGPGQGTTGTVRQHFGFENSPVSSDSNSALALSTTYYVATTYDIASGVGNIYVNGLLDKTVSVSSNPPTATDNGEPLYIGRDDRENRPSNMVLDDVALYDHALSAAQIANHYALGIAPEPGSMSLIIAGSGLLLARRRASKA